MDLYKLTLTNLRTGKGCSTTVRQEKDEFVNLGFKNLENVVGQEDVELLAVFFEDVAIEVAEKLVWFDESTKEEK